MGGPASWPWARDKTVDTPWVATPGLLSAACVEKAGHNYLSIHVNADPADPRADDISGDVMTTGTPDANWGLHLVDMNLAMGDLIRIAKTQAVAWKSRTP